VKERFFHAYFTEGEAIGDRAVLVRLAGEAGLDADEVRAVLASNRYADEVRADETAAQSIGVTGVPFFVFDGRFAVSGAQPVEVLVQVLERALASTAPAESSLPAY
jgi:predicted DsbA family dithiol-disulfide isomerase